MTVLNWFFVILILGISRMVYWLEPFGISVDESTYIAVAESWSHYGQAYVDGVDRKPPFLYGLYELIGSVFGFWNIHFVHLVFFLISLLICWLVDLIVREIAPQTPKGLAAILTAIVSGTFTREFLSCNAEIAMMLPLCLSYLVLLKALKREGVYLFGGVLLSAALAAVATAFKQIAAIPYALSMIFAGVLFLKSKNFKKLFSLVGGTLLGVSFVYAALVGYFWARGTLHDFLLWNLWDNFSYIGDTRSQETGTRPIFSPLFVSILAWPVLWWGFFKNIGEDWRRNRLLFLISFGGLLGGWLLISTSGRLFSHYFVPLSVFVVIAGAFGVSKLLVNSRWRNLAIAGLVLPFVVCSVLISFRDETLGKFGKPHTFTKAVQAKLRNLSEEIKKTTKPDARIVVWGMASQIYVMSERGSGTRFIPADYVSGRMGGMQSPAKHPFFERNLSFYLEDFERKKPEVFIDTAEAGLNDYQFFPVKEYPSLHQYLQVHYDYSGTFEGFGIWRRKNSIN